MADKTREQIITKVEERTKTMVKEILEALMREEWEIYLEQHPTKANGSSTRDLLTRVGSVEDLKVPPYGKAISTPGSSPTGRGSPWNFPRPSSFSTLSG
jgi:hypothetical protein